MNPLIAKITPDLLKGMAAEGMTITMPEKNCV